VMAITRKHIGWFHTASEEVEEEEEGLVTVGWMEGRSREPFGPFDIDFLPLASHG